jgi:hypothetical protein
VTFRQYVPFRAHQSNAIKAISESSCLVVARSLKDSICKMTAGMIVITRVLIFGHSSGAGDIASPGKGS